MEYKACPIRYTTPFAGEEKRHNPASFALLGLEPLAEYHTPIGSDPYFKFSVHDLLNELAKRKPLATDAIAYWQRLAAEEPHLEFIYRL
jgi:hypothetical protein